jgi:hypothetical protein
MGDPASIRSIDFMRNWIPGALAAAFVLLVCSVLMFIFFQSISNSKELKTGELLTDFGSFFGVASAFFAGLAFAGVCATLPFLIAQAKSAKDQVAATIRQAEIADKTNRDAARQGLFLALSQRVGEVISDSEIARMPPIPPPVLEIGLRVSGYSDESDEEFLGRESRPLRSSNIPAHDRFRRVSLFRGLDRLISNCDEFQQEMFKDALKAQIHDQAARMLIIKSLAEADTETLRIYGRLGLDFAVLNEFPRLSAELTRRFSIQ